MEREQKIDLFSFTRSQNAEISSYAGNACCELCRLHITFLHINQLIFSPGLFLVSFQVRYAEEMGSSHRDGSLLLSYIGIGSGVGKIIFGKISDLPFIDTLRLYNFCMVLSGVSPLLAIFAAGYRMLVVYVVVLGLMDGCIIGLMSIVTFECTDRDKMSEAWGGVLMIQSFSMLLGAPAAGENKIFDF